MERKRITCAVAILAVLSIMFLAIPEPAKGIRFALASWDYPDEYGQGIYTIRIFENSTGVWMHYDWFNYDDTGVIAWNASVGIMLHVYTWFNNTIFGAADYTEGANYHRHNVTVLDSSAETVFSQNNFTITGFSDAADPMWLYAYEVVLDFAPVDGELYQVTITYEMWW